MATRSFLRARARAVFAAFTPARSLTPHGHFAFSRFHFIRAVVQFAVFPAPHIHAFGFTRSLNARAPAAFARIPLFNTCFG